MQGLTGELSWGKVLCFFPATSTVQSGKGDVWDRAGWGAWLVLKPAFVTAFPST